MTKIAYNSCFGGFSLSREAIILARKLSSDFNWSGPNIIGDKYDDGSKVEHDYGQIKNIKRTDPILIQVIEILGKKASGNMSDIKIYDLPSGIKYHIHEYDGNESIMTIDDYEWEIA